MMFLVVRRGRAGRVSIDCEFILGRNGLGGGEEWGELISQKCGSR